MKKGRPKKENKDRKRNAVHTYLTDREYRAFVKKSKDEGYPSQSAYLHDLILAAIGRNA